MKKTGLVVEGGGMKCAYGAAILDAFLDNNIQFDYVIGVSAGAANAVSYLAGQRERNLRYYTIHVTDPDYFGWRPFLKHGDLFNLHHIYGDMTNSGGADPLDYEAMMANPAEFKVAATDAVTGKAHYFDKSDFRKDDYRILMGTSALPAACRPVEIDGHLYYDGGVADSIPYAKAFRDGCGKLVIILSKPRDFVKKPESFRLAYTLLCRRYPNIIRRLNRRHITYTRQLNAVWELEKKGRAFVFAPSKDLPMSTFAMDAQENQNLYDLGMEDFRRQKDDFQAFLSGREKEE